MKHVVIGAGIAGIATAVRLREQGHSVVVYEGNSHAGGKLNSLEKNGYRFDMGPSLFTLPHLVTELFTLAGEDPEKHFQFRAKKTACHYFWNDNSPFKAPTSPELFAKAAATYFDEDIDSILKYLSRSKLKYERTGPLFIEKPLNRVSTLLSVQTLKALTSIPKLDLFSSLHQTNEATFKNQKLVQLFDRYATYNGSSPFETPGIMSMIPHLELGIGTFYPKGGMIEIAHSLKRLAEKMGVQFHFNQYVEEIVHDNSKVQGVKVDGQMVSADSVVSNMDVFSTYERLLPYAHKPKKILTQERSSSGIIFFWGINRTFDSLDLHNIFFSDDYEDEFKAIFKQKVTPHDPTVYVNISSKEDKNHAPEGHENWFVMVNAPGNEGQDWEQEIKRTRAAVLNRLSKVLQTNIEEHITSEEIMDPRIIEKNTHSHQGSLYGTSSNSQYAAFNRHPNQSKQFSNLYFCGGSAHPGGGIPLCLNSAKITSSLVKQNHA